MNYKEGQYVDARSIDRIIKGKNGHWLKKLIIKRVCADSNNYLVTGTIDQPWDYFYVKEKDIWPWKHKFKFIKGDKVVITNPENNWIPPRKEVYTIRYSVFNDGTEKYGFDEIGLTVRLDQIEKI